MRLPGPIERQWRRWFGRYEIDDPRPIAEGAPYTYFLPGENELLALAPGDLAKIVFRSIPPGRIWQAERMWVAITSVDRDWLTGTLDNHPSDMPQLEAGDVVKFRRSDVIDIIWDEARMTPPPPAAQRREYWERCLVDRCVVDDGVKVDYIYREEPDMADPDDSYPDSGWRIRGDDRNATDAELDDRKAEYIALGVVLNRDDGWLHLIDAPVGARFRRNWETGLFEACAD
ncbi:DUF2185 domain-containing protein [Sphingomonas oligophenolica]|uniref:DUF2185 domain-containing protein n=1 Tax=Sphingomonas oligophenolica TaxID=301154 RepID=A0ABU9Y7E8_9SPHN